MSKPTYEELLIAIKLAVELHHKHDNPAFIEARFGDLIARAEAETTFGEDCINGLTSLRDWLKRQDDLERRVRALE